MASVKIHMLPSVPASWCSHSMIMKLWRCILFTTLPVFLVLLVLQNMYPAGGSRRLDGPVNVDCARRGPPQITDVYVIHSYWSERRDLAPELCRSLGASESEVLSSTPCTLFPGFWASAAPRSKVLELLARRIVAPETHARPLGWLSKLLYWFHFSEANPLFDDHEHVVNPSLLGIAASQLLAVQNWTLEMSRSGVPPSERINRHLLVFEDDAVVTAEGMEVLYRTLSTVNPCYDMIGLDSKESFCAISRFKDGLLGALTPSSWQRSPRLVRARTSFSRTTGMLFSYRGAIRLLSSLPVTREVDLWYRDLASDGLLDLYATCPPVIGIRGLATVS